MFSNFLRRFGVLLFCSFTSFFVAAQTPGLIVKPTPPTTSPIVLDKNQDGFTSPTTSGFVTTDVGVGFSEIPYKVVPPFKLEPTSDLMRGPNERFTDLVRISNDESGMYIFNDGTNMLFRLRLGDIVPGSKGYSILIDADGKFGATGINADPNYQPATSGINGNPGFELEVVLETNFQVAIYDVDGKTDAGTTPRFTYPLNTNSLISLAFSNVSNTPDYLYDFFVPLADLKYGTSGQVTATTPIRVSSTTVMSPQAAIGGPKSDIYGYDGKDYMAAWEDIVAAQQPFTPNQVTSGGTGLSTVMCTAAPALNSSISVGTTSFTGTWTSLDASRPSTASITLYKQVGATITVVGSVNNIASGATWTITGTAAVANEIYYATAVAAGESACAQSNSIKVVGCSNLTPTTSLAISCSSDRGISGTRPAGATVRLYSMTTAGITLFANDATGAYKITYPTTTTWEYQGVNTQNGNPCGGGAADVPVGSYGATVQLTGQCESDYVRTCIASSGGGALTQTADPVITPSIIYSGATTFSGTAAANSLVRLFVNGLFTTSVTATAGGAYTFSGLGLNVGDVVGVSAQSTNACVSNRITRTVSCYTSAPVINAISGQVREGVAITGTSNEAQGTTILVYDATVTTTAVATITVQADGTWTTGAYVAVAGKTYYAVASRTCGNSVESARVSTVSGNATVRCGTINAVAESAVAFDITGTLTGTAVTNTKVRLLANGVAIDSTTIATAINTFTIRVNESTKDYVSAGDILTIEVQEPGRISEACATSVTVSCSAPTAPNATPVSAVVSTSTGRTTITISNSISGILYTLEDASGVDRSISVFGTGGSITLTSYPNLTAGIYNYRVSAYKLGGTAGCTNSYANVTLTATDNDDDGVIDPVDIDDDNDGITDTNESVTYNATGDGDGDGVPNYKDITHGVTGLSATDANNDGILDYFDTDRDGIINQFDLDTDNDGIPDVVEAYGTDADNDGKIDGTTDANADGLRDAAGATGLAAADFDGDTVPNFRDLDSDGDGALDSRESGLGFNVATGKTYDDNANGLLSDDAGYVGGTDGWSDAVDGLTGPLSLRNTDGRGRPDYLDIDNDDDGIVDNIELRPTGSALVITGGDTDGDGIDNAYDNVSTGGTFGGTANNGIVPVNTDGDPQPDYRDLDSDNDGFPDAAEGHDTNGDNLPNANTKTKNGVGGTADVDGDGLLDGYDNNTAAVNPNNGTTAMDYPNIDVVGTIERDWREANDADKDGIIDTADNDDDNDGIADAVEGGGFNPAGDEDNDGLLNYLDQTPGAGPAFVDANGDGISDAYDVDKDGIINSLDLDSDNDGVADIVEAGGVDTNGDGKVDYTGTFAANDTDGDGLINIYDNTAIASLDTDGDSVKNFLDLDSDNDGITDVVEAGGLDANGDGRIDNYVDADGDGLDNRVDGDANNDGVVENTAGALIVTGADANNDGKPDTYPQGIANTDGRQLPNAYDLDSDDDGLADLIEAGGVDADNNGKVDVFADTDTDGLADARDGDVGNDGAAENLANVLIISEDTNSDGKPDSYTRANADGASLPNPYDLDSDNDGIPDLIEQGGVDANGDGMVDAATDANNNGRADAYDPAVAGGINLRTLDVNGATAGGLVFDFDGDGTANYLDLDADGDGIFDILEQGGTDSNNDGKVDATADTDKDGFVDTYDPVNNSNGAVLGTALITANTADATTKLPTVYSTGDNLDSKGLINMLDLDSDDDGILDSIEGKLDTDGDGKANYLDIDSDNDGIVDHIEAQTTSGYIAPTGNDTDADGVDNAYDGNAVFGAAGITPVNTDGADGADYLDLDSDNDGFGDRLEGWDTNGNKSIDGTEKVYVGTTDADGDGLLNEYDNSVGFNPTNGATPASYPNMDKPATPERDWREVADNDGDGIPDSTDLDDDNDGITDAVEGGTTDTDGDGIINSFDLDSDNDGIADVVEAGGLDADNDGKIDGTTDANADGLRDAAGAGGLATADFDGDGVPNFRDLDSDGDGILDTRESGLAGDANNNGVLSDDAGYTDANRDGWSDAIDALAALNLTNTDGTGKPNFLDIDSDDDGLTDNVEGQATATYVAPVSTDGDSDGINDQYDNNDAMFGGNANNGITPNNHDGTDEPDYMDLDTDNDTDLDRVEGNDLNNNARADDLSGLNTTDTDGDGLVDFFDADNTSPKVTLFGFGGGTGGRSTAQRTLNTFSDRDWRNSSFSLTAQALPVRFVSVRATLRSSGAHIDWQVAEEQNVLHYEVERSLNGSHFEKIGTVAYKSAAGAENSYAFIDGASMQQNRYYRIRQVDIDGKSMYSTTVMVRANSTVATPVLQLYPNPATPASVMVLEAHNSQKVQVLVVDGKGQTVARQTVTVQKGSNVVPASLIRSLAKGMYVLLAEIDGQRQQVKFIK